MIRRLIEKKHRRGFQKEFGQRDPHLPATAEFFRISREILYAKSESHQYFLNARLHAIGVEVLQTMLQFADNFKQFCVFFRFGRVTVERIESFIKP
ncbi:hypothetical protein D3C83_65560 [compost metagenome]